MESANSEAEALKQLISATERNLEALKNQLAKVERRGQSDIHTAKLPDVLETLKDNKWPLTADEYLRYGRQMIVPSIGIQGQHIDAASGTHEANQGRPTASPCRICAHNRGWRLRL